MYRQDNSLLADAQRRWFQEIPTSSFQSSVPHSSVAALHAPVRTTTGTEIIYASKLYVQQLGEHWGALQAARRIFICQSDKLKQSTSTQVLCLRWDPLCLAGAGWDGKETARLADRATQTFPTPKREAELCKEAPALSPASLCHFPGSPL